MHWLAKKILIIRGAGVDAASLAFESVFKQLDSVSLDFNVLKVMVHSWHEPCAERRRASLQRRQWRVRDKRSR